MEILVHISAPSRGKDDARYRTEAKGFLDFEPVDSHSISGYEWNNLENAEGSVPSEHGISLPKINQHQSGRKKQMELELAYGDGADSYGGFRKRRRLCGNEDTGRERSKNISIFDKENLLKATDNRTYTPEDNRTVCEQKKCVIGHSEGELSRDEGGYVNQPVQYTFGCEEPLVSRHVHKTPNHLAVCSKTPKPSDKYIPTVVPWTGIKETPHLLIARTPALGRPRTAPTEPSKSQDIPVFRRTQSDSWQTPPSTIPDSQPSIHSSDAFEMASSPCLHQLNPLSSPSPTRHSPPPTSHSTPQEPSFEEPLASSSPLAIHDSTSSEKDVQIQVPSSPPNEDLGSTPSPIRNSPSALKLPRLEIPSSPPMEQSPTRNVPSARSDPPPPAKRPRPEVPSSPPLEYPPISGSPMSNPPPSPQQILAAAPRQRWENQIHPPPPPISNDHFVTHSTPHLKIISSKLTIKNGFFRYVVEQSRKPCILERGHWLIPLKNWSEKVFADLWDFLLIYVGKGYAGWATWAIKEMVQMEDGEEVAYLDEDGSRRRSGKRPNIRKEQQKEAEREEVEKEKEAQESSTANKEEQPPGEKQEVLKVFCWGETIAEIWLLLYIGSGSSKPLIKNGTKWIAADGEIVFTME